MFQIKNVFRLSHPFENMCIKYSSNVGFGVTVFSATFNNISVISWWSVLNSGGNRKKPQICHKLLTKYSSNY